MAPLPFELTTSTNETALRVNTLLAFLAILFAGMQGTLCIESADPCRISYTKLLFLLSLELSEVIVVLVSETLSFTELQGSLQHRLQWLYWMPRCLLVLGLLQLLLDINFTVSSASDSRIHWIPFSSVGYTSRSSPFDSRSFLEIVPLLLTGTVSLLLVGWRQKWWMVADMVRSEVATVAVRHCGALSVWAIGFCFAWGFLLTGGLLCWSIMLFIRERVYDDWGYMLNPKEFWKRFPEKKYPGNKVNEKRIEQHKILFQIQFGSSAFEQLKDLDVKRCLETAPLCMGNAVVEEDRVRVYSIFNTRVVHMLFLFGEHFTILPLQLCVAIGLIQVHDRLDLETMKAMKEIVDAVVVVAFVEIAVGLKSFLWGVGSVGALHDHDKRIGDP